jgi:2-oxopent-4-enoate/cis-2-oxohex-4-enoate hydratase
LISDNASFGAYVLGDKMIGPKEPDMEMRGMVLEVNGKTRCSGIGAAVMGHPVNALIWLARKAYAMNDPLRAGEIILTGSFISGESAGPGDYFKATFNNSGSVSVHFV